MPVRDVTDNVETGEIDDELLVVTRCVCGKKFGRWEHVISIYSDDPKACPYCGRKLYFSYVVTVYEVCE